MALTPSEFAARAKPWASKAEKLLGLSPERADRVGRWISIEGGNDPEEALRACGFDAAPFEVATDLGAFVRALRSMRAAA